MSRRKKRSRFSDRIIEIIVMCIIVDLGILSIYHTATSIYHVQSNDLILTSVLAIIVIIDLLIIFFGNKAFEFLMKIVQDLHWYS